MAFAELQRANRILKPLVTQNLATHSQYGTSELIVLEHSTSLMDEYSTIAAAAAGTAVGGILAAGSWAAISRLGTASTGVAISGLHGVAATNAALAWFGSGSLAAGGGVL